MPRIRPGTTLLLLLGALACDRAGIGTDFEPPTALARQDLRIGSVDDAATALTFFGELVVAPDGRIYTLHRQENAVRVHDADGRFVRTIGRAGAGPGEFRNPARLGLHGDTLWVLDFGTYRFSLFDLAGNSIADRTIPVDLGDGMTGNPPRPRGMLSDGTVWGSPPAWSDQVADGIITRSVNLRLDTTGAVIDTLAEYSLVNTSWRLHDPSNPRGTRSFRDQPFSVQNILRVSEHRAEIVIVERPVAADRARAAFRITKLGFGGDTIYTVSFPYVPVPIAERLVDSLVRAFAEPPPGLPERMLASRPTAARAIELARASLFVPDHLPPVREVVLGHDGTVWVQREETGGGPGRRWWIIDERGRAVASVTLPAGFRVLAAERNRVWGSETDELDVPYIVRYTLYRE